TIYAVEKFGLDAVAAKVFPQEEVPGVAPARLLRQLHGKVSYLRMIRGKGDWLAADMAHRFNTLHGTVRLRVPSVEMISNPNRKIRGVHIVVAYAAAVPVFDPTEEQGTAFTTPSGLLVTAAHVLEREDTKTLLPFVYVMNERKLSLTACDVLAVDWHRDIAILRVRDDKNRVSAERSRYRLGQDPQQGGTLTSIGYPDYARGQHGSAFETPVTKLFRIKIPVGQDILKARVGGPIQGGMSGGPAIDSNFEVRGVILKGVANPGGVPEIIAISEVRRVAQANGLKL
ncbi:trypsin-like peptidase domain-containing protein, partial [Stenotrophomonas maltophilia]|nr:trypsin-like peptidase domain-containing protein [Stenotrophomonas maltophilia]